MVSRTRRNVTLYVHCLSCRYDGICIKGAVISFIEERKLGVKFFI
jgi:hypothetical protein